MHGVESTEISAAACWDWWRRNGGLMAIRLDDERGGNYLRLYEGGQSLALNLAKLVGEENIHLASEVVSIEDHDSHITTSFDARKCIISLPSTMYHQLSISPPLPSSLLELSHGARQGDYGKITVAYDAPYWQAKGYNGLVMSFSGPIALVKETSIENIRHYALTCFVNGAACREWARLYPHERRQVALKQLAFAYDDERMLQPIEFFDLAWKDEEFSQGALCPILAMVHLTEEKYRGVYGRKVGNLHFVGTEYANIWKGHMEGALDSGERGAREVVEAMKA